MRAEVVDPGWNSKVVPSMGPREIESDGQDSQMPFAEQTWRESLKKVPMMLTLQLTTLALSLLRDTNSVITAPPVQRTSNSPTSSGEATTSFSISALVNSAVFLKSSLPIMEGVACRFLLPILNSYISSIQNLIELYLKLGRGE